MWVKELRLGIVSVTVVAISILGASGLSYLLPYLIALKEGARIVKSYTISASDSVTVQDDKLCMNGGMLVTGYHSDGHGGAALEFLKGAERDHFVVNMVNRTYICGNRRGNFPGSVSIPQEDSMQYKPEPQVLNWYAYKNGTTQKSAFLLPNLGEGGAYFVEDWSDDWVLLNQHVSTKAESDTVVLLNIHSGEIVRPHFSLGGATYAGILVQDGITFHTEHGVYLADMHGMQTTKLGPLKGGAQQFDAAGPVIAWGGSGKKAQVVIRDMEKDKEWVVDGQMPMLVGGKVIRVMQTGDGVGEDGTIPMVSLPLNLVSQRQ